MGKRFSDIVDFLFPHISVGDHTVGSYLSSGDKKTLKSHPEVCPASHFFSSDFRTLSQYRKDFVCEGIHIAFVYSDYLKKLILKLKYDHRYDIAMFLAERLALSIQTNHTLMDQIRRYPSYITHVPTHRRRKRFFRGYNQSELLAQALSTYLSIPHIDLYTKTRYTHSQTKLKRQQRLYNLLGAFTMQTVNIPDNSCIIIVDDITTTGSTISQLAKITKKAFPKGHVRGVVLGRHQS